MRRSVGKGNAFTTEQKSGEVSEWSKEHAWKVCKSKGFEGSNPSLSATEYRKSPLSNERAFLYLPFKLTTCGLL